MYEKFYGLKDNPFRMTPDPAFYYATTRHNEALANLTYGVLMQKGFIVLTGEVGTGKTLLSAACLTPCTVRAWPTRISSIRSSRPMTCCT